MPRGLDLLIDWLEEQEKLWSPADHPRYPDGRFRPKLGAAQAASRALDALDSSLGEMTATINGYWVERNYQGGTNDYRLVAPDGTTQIVRTRSQAIAILAAAVTPKTGRRNLRRPTANQGQRAAFERAIHFDRNGNEVSRTRAKMMVVDGLIEDLKDDPDVKAAITAMEPSFTESWGREDTELELDKLRFDRDVRSSVLAALENRDEQVRTNNLTPQEIDELQERGGISRSLQNAMKRRWERGTEWMHLARERSALREVLAENPDDVDARQRLEAAGEAIKRIQADDARVLEMWEIEKGELRDELRDTEGALAEVREQYRMENGIGNMVRQWAETSADGDPEALAFQHAVAAEFGMGLSHLEGRTLHDDELTVFDMMTEEEYLEHQEFTDTAQRLEKLIAGTYVPYTGDWINMPVAEARVRLKETREAIAELEALVARRSSAGKLERYTTDPQIFAGLRKIARAQYERTQRWLDERGIRETRVYRGMNWYDDVQGRTGLATLIADAEALLRDPNLSDEDRYDTIAALAGYRKRLAELGLPPPFTDEAGFVELDSQPASSWSLDFDNALQFTGPNDYSEMVRAVLVADVPAERILATPQTGYGAQSEDEILVLGAPEGETDEGYVWAFVSGADDSERPWQANDIEDLIAAGYQGHGNDPAIWDDVILPARARRERETLAAYHNVPVEQIPEPPIIKAARSRRVINVDVPDRNADWIKQLGWDVDLNGRLVEPAVKKFDPNQPRDQAGRWTATGLSGRWASDALKALAEAVDGWGETKPWNLSSQEVAKRPELGIDMRGEYTGYNEPIAGRFETSEFRITMNARTWDSDSPAERARLLYHEAGHAVFQRANFAHNEEQMEVHQPWRFEGESPDFYNPFAGEGLGRGDPINVFSEIGPEVYAAIMMGEAEHELTLDPVLYGPEETWTPEERARPGKYRRLFDFYKMVATEIGFPTEPTWKLEGGLRSEKAWNETLHPRDRLGRFRRKIGDMGRFLKPSQSGVDQGYKLGRSIRGFGMPREAKAEAMRGLADRLVDNEKFQKAADRLGILGSGESAAYEEGVRFRSQPENLPLDDPRWTNLSETEREDAAIRLADTELAIHWLMKSWQGTSGDHQLGALMLQRAAAREFGGDLGHLEDRTPSGDVYGSMGNILVISAWNDRESVENKWEKLKDDDEVLDGLGEFVRAMYDWTQDYLEDQGIEKVTLYRGMVYGASDPELGSTSRSPFPLGASRSGVDLQPLSSFTTDLNIAKVFARGSSDQVIVAATVPRDRIASVPLTGLGALHEAEALVISTGEPEDALVFTRHQDGFGNESGIHLYALTPERIVDVVESGEAPPIIDDEQGFPRVDYYGKVDLGDWKAARRKRVNLDEDDRNADWIKFIAGEPPLWAQEARKDFDPNQPRDRLGRWTRTGLGGGSLGEDLLGALRSWKGDPSTMRIHLRHELDGDPEPSSAGGRDMRAKARALLKELRENAKPIPKRGLWRGGKVIDIGPYPFSESKAAARGFGGEEPLHLTEGKGLRVADYLPGGFAQEEKEWIVLGPFETHEGGLRQARTGLGGVAISHMPTGDITAPDPDDIGPDDFRQIWRMGTAMTLGPRWREKQELGALDEYEPTDDQAKEDAEFVMGILDDTGGFARADRARLKSMIMRRLAKRLEDSPSWQAFAPELVRRVERTTVGGWDWVDLFEQTEGVEPPKTDSEKATAWLVHAWAQSATQIRETYGLQRAALQEFGLAPQASSSLSGALTPTLAGVYDRSITETEHQGYVSFLRAMYEETQEALDDLGVEKLLLFRGVREVHQDTPKGEAQIREWHSNPISSWSLSYWTAKNFEEDQGVVLMAEVPRERILSTAITGFGALFEAEVVVLGQNEPEKAWSVKAPEFAYGPRAWQFVFDAIERADETGAPEGKPDVQLPPIDYVNLTSVGDVDVKMTAEQRRRLLVIEIDGLRVNEDWLRRDRDDFPGLGGIEVAGKGWNPADHPRDPATGKFIEKWGGLVRTPLDDIYLTGDVAALTKIARGLKPGESRKGTFLRVAKGDGPDAGWWDVRGQYGGFAAESIEEFEDEARKWLGHERAGAGDQMHVTRTGDARMADEHVGYLSENASRRDREALADWGSVGYAPINAAIRGEAQDYREGTAYLWTATASTQEALRIDRLLEDAPELPEDLTLWRWIDTYGSDESPETIASVLPVGSVVQLAGGGFQSASTRIDPNPQEQHGRVLVKITGAERGLYLGAVSRHDEEEVLLPRSAVWRVRAIRAPVDERSKWSVRTVVEVERA